MASFTSNYHAALVDAETFAITWELVPGRGAVEDTQEEVIRQAEQAAAGGKVHALSLTDNPGGNPAISAEMLGAEISR
ncbi:MAG: methylenetetrahydrofolate reductase, partial [Chloroflexi bacterium]|nr:methylenetetrahydrofolate reductase [Chloroflexota bacterium]